MEDALGRCFTPVDHIVAAIEVRPTMVASHSHDLHLLRCNTDTSHHSFGPLVQSTRFQLKIWVIGRTGLHRSSPWLEPCAPVCLGTTADVS